MGRDVKGFLKSTRWLEARKSIFLCFQELGSLPDTWDASPAGQAGECPGCLNQGVENSRTMATWARDANPAVTEQSRKRPLEAARTEA